MVILTVSIALKDINNNGKEILYLRGMLKYFPFFVRYNAQLRNFDPNSDKNIQIMV